MPITLPSLPADTSRRHRVAAAAAILLAGTALGLFPLPWLTTGVVSAFVVCLVLLRPHVALLLICFAVSFGSLWEVDLGGVRVGITEALIALGLGAWAARSVAFRGQRWSWPPLSPLVALFVGAALLSLLNAAALLSSAKEILKWAEFLGIMLFVGNSITRRKSYLLVAALLLTGLAQAVLGAYQFLTRSGPESFVLLGRYIRAYGAFEQPNPYGGYLGLLAPLALAFSIPLAQRAGQVIHKDATPTPLWLGWLALGVFVAVSAAIGMSWSRGAWLGFGAACLAVLAIYARNRATWFALALVLLMGGLLINLGILPQGFTAPIGERLGSFIPFLGIRDVSPIEVTDANYAALERLAHWQSALSMWQDHPWLGVGIGNYEAAYPQYALPKWPLALGHAHNYYLNIAAEAGLVGLFAYALLWVTAFWQVGRTAVCCRDPYVKGLSIGAFGMLVHLTVHNLVDNLWVHNLYIHVAIVLGMVQSTQIVTTAGTRGASA